MLQANQRLRGPGGGKGVRPSSLDHEPLVSVVIPSRNSARTIDDCLRSIILQSYKRIEIIIVDCISTDSTREIAQRMGALVISQYGERSVAKNLGAKFANGKYLFFVDADHKLGPDVIASCIKSIDGFDGVLINDQDISKDSKVSRLVASRRKVLSYDPLHVAVRFVRRDVFDSVGGFDPDLYAGDDFEFHWWFLRTCFEIVYYCLSYHSLGSLCL